MSNQKKGFSHAMIEQNVGLLIVLSILVIAAAGLVQIVPLFFQHSTTVATPGVKPYEPLRLMGRDIYIREGCVGCHSQQVRMLQSEVQRYGPYSLAGETVYDHPFLWGSKRTGPDLARVGGLYTDNWHRIHLRNPRDTEPASNMPAYPWLQHASVEGANVQDRMRGLRSIGVPYTDEEIEKAPEQLVGKTEEDALIAYLQGLGVQGRAAAEEAVAEGLAAPLPPTEEQPATEAAGG